MPCPCCCTLHLLCASLSTVAAPLPAYSATAWCLPGMPLMPSLCLLESRTGAEKRLHRRRGASAPSSGGRPLVRAGGRGRSDGWLTGRWVGGKCRVGVEGRDGTWDMHGEGCKHRSCEKKGARQGAQRLHVKGRQRATASHCGGGNGSAKNVTGKHVGAEMRCSAEESRREVQGGRKGRRLWPRSGAGLGSPACRAGGQRACPAVAAPPVGAKPDRAAGPRRRAALGRAQRTQPCCACRAQSSRLSMMALVNSEHLLRGRRGGGGGWGGGAKADNSSERRRPHG